MVDTPKITESIEVTGGTVVTKTFEDIARSAETTFGRVKQAFNSTKGLGTNLTNELGGVQSKLGVVAGVAGNTGASLANAFRSTARPIADHTDRLATAEAAGIKFGTSIRNLAGHFINLGGGVANADLPLNRFLKTMQSVAIVAAGIGVTRGLSRFISDAGEGATETKNFAASVGLTVEQFSKYKNAAAQAGVGEEQLRRGLSKLNEELVLTKEHGAANSALFKDLAIAGEGAGTKVASGFQKAGFQTETADQVFKKYLATVKSSDNIQIVAGGRAKAMGEQFGNVGDVLNFLADRTKQLGSATDQAGLAFKLFGVRGSQWTEFLTKGSEGISVLVKETDQFSAGSARRVEALDVMNLSSKRLTGTVKALKLEFIALIAPNLTALTTSFASNISQNWDRIVQGFKPVTDLLNQGLALLTEKLKENPQALGEAVAFVAEKIVEIGNAAKLAYTIASTAFGLITAALEPVASIIKEIAAFFGVQNDTIKNLSGSTLAWTGIIIGLVGGFGLLSSAIGVVTGAIRIFFLLAASNPWTLLIGALVLAVGFLAVKFGPELWEGIKSAWASGTKTISSMWSATMDFLKSAGDFFADYFKTTTLGQIVEAAKTAFQKIKELFKGATDLSKSSLARDAGIGDIGKFQAGGHIRGRGGRRGDKIPILASDYEYMQPASAVEYYGVSFMDAIRRLAIPKDFFRGFADGGLISFEALLPQPVSFASSGAIPTQSLQRPIHVHFGGDTFEMSAPEDVAAKVIRAARNRRKASAQKKPSYYGAR